MKHSFGIYFDANHVVRCKGRLNKSDLDISSRNPIPLPRNGHLILLIIRKARLRTKHGGVKDYQILLDIQYYYY